MSQVIIGMDPHKRSATIEVMAGDETVVGGGRYGTDAAGYRAMLDTVKRWPQRTWAIEGCQGTGRHIARRLLADGEDVTDVPASAGSPMTSSSRCCGYWPTATAPWAKATPG